MTSNCLIIGSEIAALRSAMDLAAFAIPVILINPSKLLGETTKILQRNLSDNSDGSDILQVHLKALESNPLVTVLNEALVTKVISKKSPFEVEIQQKDHEISLTAGAVILATGFEFYNASNAREYGHGRLEKVMTSIELEKAFQEDRLPISEDVDQVMFILCVGSRSSRANPDCSSYCCGYAVDQALRIKKKFPRVKVSVMYMDIRTVANQEFLYNEARREGVAFIRGRPASLEGLGDKIYGFTEDTMAEEQDLLTTDLAVLAVGGKACSGCVEIATGFGVEQTSNGFVRIVEKPVKTSTPGVFACGSASEGVKNLRQSLSEGAAAAMAAVKYLKGSRND